MNPVATCIVLLALSAVAIGQAAFSAECQLGCSRLVGATPGNTDRLFCGCARFPMPPESAVQAFERRSELQEIELRGYSATTLISVELPELSRQGELELRRVYTAPKTLEFTPVRFTGDNFVKTNVIARLLQSEVTRLQNPQRAATAINAANYKIAFKGTSQIDGRLVHEYRLKPRQRRVGLFEGRMFLDVFSGSLVRSEGLLVKMPSWVLKKVEFVQDYADIGNFTFLKHTHSVANARIIGRTVVEIHHYNYLFPPTAPAAVDEQRLAEAGTGLLSGH